MRYLLFGSSFVNEQDVAFELFNTMLFFQSQAMAVYISARYPVTDPPFAVSAGGLQVTLIKLQPPVKFECKTG